MAQGQWAEGALLGPRPGLSSDRLWGPGDSVPHRCPPRSQPHACAPSPGQAWQTHRVAQEARAEGPHNREFSISRVTTCLLFREAWRPLPRPCPRAPGLSAPGRGTAGPSAAPHTVGAPAPTLSAPSPCFTKGPGGLLLPRPLVPHSGRAVGSRAPAGEVLQVSAVPQRPPPPPQPCDPFPLLTPSHLCPPVWGAAPPGHSPHTPRLATRSPLTFSAGPGLHHALPPMGRRSHPAGAGRRHATCPVGSAARGAWGDRVPPHEAQALGDGQCPETCPHLPMCLLNEGAPTSPVTDVGVSLGPHGSPRDSRSAPPRTGAPWHLQMRRPPSPRPRAEALSQGRGDR